MIKWYLVLYIIGTSSSSMITIPQTYNDKQACEEAAKDWDSWGSGRNYMCIKAPARSACTCNSGNMAVLCECSVQTGKGYVCQPGATTCEVVK